jgi:hypothetical protein
MAKAEVGLSTFMAAVLLSLSRIQRLESRCLDLLRHWIAAAHRDAARRRAPLWADGVTLSPLSPSSVCC